MNIQTIQNAADLQLLYQPLNLFLKPNASLTINIAIPSNVATSNKAISNFDVMDKLRQMILPDIFSILKVSKTTLETLRFDAELDDRNKVKNVISRLDGRKVKLNGFTEYAQVKASESKCDFATRHDWDSYFRDAKNCDEMKAGERPDTVYISNLPIKWFCPRHNENDANVKPSESLFKRIFEKFGEVKLIDIPICDPYRNQMKTGLTGLKNFSFDNDTYFEGYVQFSEYGSFVRAMDEFRAMKLVRKEVDKHVAVNIQVTFDKTKHLSDASVKRRKVIRDRLIEKDREKAEEEEKKLRIEQERKEKERQKEEAKKQILLDKQRQREERRKQKYIQKISQEESTELTKKIHKEQKKLLKTQRKVESIRLLEALFERIKTKYNIEDASGPSKDFKGFDLRNKLNKKKPSSSMIKPNDIKKERSLSITSISSNDSILSDPKAAKGTKKKSKKKRDSSSSSSNSSSSSSSESSRNDRKRKKNEPPPQGNGMYPGWMNHPESGEWIPATNYMYAPPFYPGMVPRPYYNPNFRGGYSSRPRGRGRGRGRGYYNNYENDGRYKRYDDEYYDDNDRRSPRRRRSYSRSRSRSRSHRRRKSYSRSKSSSRSRSHTHRSKSRSKSRQKRRDSRSRSPSKVKLVTTLRDGDTSKPPPSTRRNRSRSGSGWSSDGYRKSGKSRKTWSRENSPGKEKMGLEPERLLRSAKEIQIHVQKKLKEQEEAKERKMKELQSNGDESEKSNYYQRRSTSLDSSKFQSPKRTAKTMTPELA